MNFTPNFFEATHSLPDPAKGTTNRFSSPLFIQDLISFSQSSNGF